MWPNPPIIQPLLFNLLVSCAHKVVKHALQILQQFEGFLMFSGGIEVEH